MFEEVETDEDGKIIGVSESDGTHFDLTNFWAEGIVVKETEQGEEEIRVDI